MSAAVKILTHPGLCLAFRLALAWLFLGAAWPKLVCPAAFSVSVAAYRIAPDSLINLTAVTLPWTELFVGIGILIGLRVRACALILIGQLLFFIAMLAIAITAGVTAESCGCEVPGFTEEFGWDSVWRDVVFIALAVHVALFDKRGYSVDGLLARRAAG